MNEFLKQVYLGNTVQAYLTAFGAIILTWLVFKLVKGALLTAIKKIAAGTKTQYDDVIISAAEKFLVPYLYLFINYQIITALVLSTRMQRVLEVAMALITTVYAIRLINHVLHKSVELYMTHKNEPQERMRQLNGILLVIKAIIWAIGFIMLIGNLGYDITTMIAGLGVGGIAIALAAQNILSDLFSYFVIFFDKPFEVGDFISMGTNTGTVEKIGIKTSHVRSVSGEQLIMPNAELVKSVIKNFKRLQRRRIAFTIGVVYETDEKLLREIPEIIRSIIEKTENVTFDRCHFQSFGDFSINFETIYFVEAADYMVYMNAQQDIYLGIFSSFQPKGISFAYPTQALYIQQSNLPEAVVNDKQ